MHFSIQSVFRDLHDYDLTAIKRAERFLQGLMALRVLLSFLVCYTVWLVADLPAVLAMCGLFAVALALQGGILHLLPQRVGPWGVAGVLAMTIAVGLVYVATLAVIWLSPVAAVRFVSIGALALLMIDSTCARREDVLLIVGDLPVIASGAAMLPVLSYVWLGDAPEALMTAVLTITMFVFYVVGLNDTLTAQRRLAAAQAQALGSARVEAVGRLTGGVAHDFNNLLTVIAGNLDLLDENLPAAERRKLLEEARDAARRAGTVTAQLLAYARKAVLVPRAVDPRASVDVVCLLLGRLLPAGITLRVDAQPGLPRLLVDPSQFETVLMNLCLNARDSIAQNGSIDILLGVIDVRPRQFYGASGPLPARLFLRVCVADTGSGIAPEDLPHVCDPYFSTKGAGLGLSMAKGFVEQSGGAIRVESQLGVGTRVTLLFPIAPPERVATAAALPGAGAAVPGIRTA